LRVYYHGTEREYVEDILENGLSSDGELVFLTSDPGIALLYGPVVLKIKLPEGFRKLKEWGEDFTTSFIPPKYIEVYREFSEEERQEYRDEHEKWMGYRLRRGIY